MLRKEREITQRTLATMIQTSHGFVAEVEKDGSKCKYSANHIYLIAKNFGCSLYDIYPPIDPLAP
ncbi:MAG: helix-turn-helix domain-containing protein [Rikenellaceae bacterium]|nr:helix-turn-helix domain-containing protein [Rikenellaceae bacterium]